MVTMSRGSYSGLVPLVICLLVVQGNTQSCPSREEIQPCRCKLYGADIKITCSNSDFQKISYALSNLVRRKRDVSEMVLVNNKIPEFPSRAFGSLLVDRLVLRNNRIQLISPNAFVGQESSLSEIFIEEGFLHDVSLNTFQGLESLESLIFQSTPLRAIPNLEGLQRLYLLRIDGSFVSDLVEKALHRVPALRFFHLTNSMLTHVHAGAFSGLSSLRLVNLTLNYLQMFHPRAFMLMDAVQEIILSHNNITDLSKLTYGFRDVTSLRYLDFSHNLVTSLGESAVANIDNLDSLDLSHNMILSIHERAFYNLPSLRKLDIGFNDLSTLPSGIFLDTEHLEDLNLGHNYIKFIEEVGVNTRSLVSLRILDLSYNQIDDVTKGAFTDHISLQRLKLDGNLITQVKTDSFEGLTNLESLHLDGNGLTEATLRLGKLTKLKTLTLSHNMLGAVTENMLTSLPMVTHLDLSSNQIARVAETAFSAQRRHLEVLRLAHNQITGLDKMTFDGMTKLVDLDLGHNRITALGDDLLSACVNLEQLDLCHNQITGLTPGAMNGKVTRLKSLDLSGNGLTKVPSESLRTLRALQHLDLSDNFIVSIETESLDNLPALTRLDLSHNKIKQVMSGGFKQLTTLRSLNLAWNELEELGDQSFTGLGSLVHLNLTVNLFKQAPKDAFQPLRSLETLIMSNNSLSELSDTLLALPSLRMLDLSSNIVSNVSSRAFKELPSLQTLYLQDNFLEAIPNGAFSKMWSLRRLHIYYNDVMKLEPRAFQELPDLEELRLDKNLLKVIEDDTFVDLVSLQTLNLGGNQLSEIKPQALVNVPNLRSLNLSSNNLIYVPNQALSGSLSLEELDLSHNLIVGVNETSFSQLDWITLLKMNNNQLCRVAEKTFSRLTALRHLDLRNNQLRHLPGNSMGLVYNRMDRVDLAGNPMECDCKANWLKSMEEPLGLRTRDVVCQGPSSLKGRSLEDVRPDELQCGRRDGLRQLDIDDICDNLTATIESLRQQHNDLLEQSLSNGATLDLLNLPLGDDWNLESLLQSNNLTELADIADLLNLTSWDNLSDLSDHQSEEIPSPVVQSLSQPLSLSPDLTSGDTPTIYAGSVHSPSNNLNVQEGHKGIENEDSLSLFGIKFTNIPKFPTLNSLNLPNMGLNLAALGSLIPALLLARAGLSSSNNRKKGDARPGNKHFNRPQINLPESIIPPNLDPYEVYDRDDVTGTEYPNPQLPFHPGVKNDQYFPAVPPDVTTPSQFKFPKPSVYDQLGYVTNPSYQGSGVKKQNFIFPGGSSKHPPPQSSKFTFPGNSLKSPASDRKPPRRDVYDFSKGSLSVTPNRKADTVDTIAFPGHHISQHPTRFNYAHFPGKQQDISVPPHGSGPSLSLSKIKLTPVNTVAFDDSDLPRGFDNVPSVNTVIFDDADLPRGFDIRPPVTSYLPPEPNRPPYPGYPGGSLEKQLDVSAWVPSFDQQLRQPGSQVFLPNRPITTYFHSETNDTMPSGHLQEGAGSTVAPTGSSEPSPSKIFLTRRPSSDAPSNVQSPPQSAANMAMYGQVNPTSPPLVIPQSTPPPDKGVLIPSNIASSPASTPSTDTFAANLFEIVSSLQSGPQLEETVPVPEPQSPVTTEYPVDIPSKEGGYSFGYTSPSDYPTENPWDGFRDISKDTLRDNPTNRFKDSPKDTARDNPKDIPKDTAKDSFKDSRGYADSFSTPQPAVSQPSLFSGFLSNSDPTTPSSVLPEEQLTPGVMHHFEQDRSELQEFLKYLATDIPETTTWADESYTTEAGEEGPGFIPLSSFDLFDRMKNSSGDDLEIFEDDYVDSTDEGFDFEDIFAIFNDRGRDFLPPNSDVTEGKTIDTIIDRVPPQTTPGTNGRYSFPSLRPFSTDTLGQAAEDVSLMNKDGTPMSKDLPLPIRVGHEVEHPILVHYPPTDDFLERPNVDLSTETLSTLATTTTSRVEHVNPITPKIREEMMDQPKRVKINHSNNFAVAMSPKQWLETFGKDDDVSGSSGNHCWWTTLWMVLLITQLW